MNNFGRIVACGMISEYNKVGDEKYPLRNLMSIVAKRITMRGFIVGDKNMGKIYKAECSPRCARYQAFKLHQRLTIA